MRGPYGRIDRLIKEKRHDAYQEKTKWPEPTLCSKCGAVFVNGRWTWNEVIGEADETICPACQRIADRYPAGQIEIKGSFFKVHRYEILNLIRNVEAQEKSERPLERIISTSSRQKSTLITTTGIHIARRIGEALASAYQGDLSLQYLDGEQSIRVTWQR